MATHSRVRSFIVYLAGLLIVGGAAVVVFLLWQQRDSSLNAATKALAETVERGPKVQVVTVRQGPKERLITLLGDTRADQVATVYAKIGGYLKSISVERGDMVQAGQVLAEVESAETDRQYDSAVTDLENKRRNAARAQELMAHGSMSVQAAEQAQTDFRMATANVAQLATLKSYELLRAPFAGRVSARFVDVGALVQNSTTNQTSNQPVLTVSDSSKLRVDIYVEQRDVPFVHVGDGADVSDGASSERKIQAKVARTSGELDPRTRTLFVELDVDNSSHFLVPGAFAYVTLHVPIDSYPEIPVAGLLTRGTATYVADVGDDNLVHLHPVKIANSDGTKVSLREGARVGQRVVVNLPDEVTDGGRVQPVSVGAK
jgi:membrane fusion protein (multidrug efflux system)